MNPFNENGSVLTADIALVRGALTDVLSVAITPTANDKKIRIAVSIFGYISSENAGNIMRWQLFRNNIDITNSNETNPTSSTAVDGGNEPALAWLIDEPASDVEVTYKLQLRAVMLIVEVEKGTSLYVRELH